MKLRVWQRGVVEHVLNNRRVHDGDPFKIYEIDNKGFLGPLSIKLKCLDLLLQLLDLLLHGCQG